MNKAVGKRVKRLRQEKDLTQGQLARKAGITANTLRGLENGTLNTRWPKIEKVARALGTTAESLVHGDEPMQATDERLKGLGNEDFRIARLYHDSPTAGRNIAKAVLTANIEDEQLEDAIKKFLIADQNHQQAVIGMLRGVPEKTTSSLSDTKTEIQRKVIPPK